MKHLILCIGRQANDPLLALTNEYLERLSHYTRYELVRLKEGSVASESELLLKAIPSKNSWIIALDEKGTQLSTVQLSTMIQKHENQSTQSMVWIIGGTNGLHENIKTKANMLMSLSALTFPHRLAQTILAEQLYRAYTILRGEKYHRA